MREDYRVNTDLANAIAELRELKEGLKSNLLASVDEAFGEKLRVFENSKIDTENLEFVGFRCYSEKIRKAINEIDLYDLSPEYVGRENPFLTACYEGSDDGELFNPKGIALDRARNEVYVCDTSNSRIQVLSTVGEYVRQFGRHHLTEPYAICLLQQDELFHCVHKFKFPTIQFVD